MIPRRVGRPLAAAVLAVLAGLGAWAAINSTGNPAPQVTSTTCGGCATSSSATTGLVDTAASSPTSVTVTGPSAAATLIPPTVTVTAATPTTTDPIAVYTADQYPRTDPAAARRAVEQTCAALAGGGDPVGPPAATAGLLPAAYPDLARFGIRVLCPDRAAALETAIAKGP